VPTPHARPGPFVTRRPFTSSAAFRRRRREDLPGSPADPCTCAPSLLRPRRIECRWPVARHPMLPSATMKTSAPDSNTIEARSRGSHAPCVRFAGPVTRHHATLGSGWWPAFAGRDSHPPGPLREVSETSIIPTSVSFPSPELSWRTIVLFGIRRRVLDNAMEFIVSI